MPGPGHNNHNLWLVLPQSQFGFNFPALLQLCFPAAPSDGRWVMGNACTLEFRSWGLFLPGIFKIWVLFLLHLGWPFMVPEVNVFPDSGRISWDQGVAPSGDLRSKHGPAEPKAEGFIPSVQPFLRRGMEVNGCVTMDMNPTGMVHWILMGILIPAWGLCTPQVCFYWSSQFQEWSVLGTGSHCNPGKAFLHPILVLSPALLSKILGSVRLEKSKRPLDSLFQLVTTFPIQSLLLVSGRILFHFNLDFLPWGWWQWNPALEWGGGARTHPSFCCGDHGDQPWLWQLSLDNSRSCGLFLKNEIKFGPTSLGLCHNSLAEFQGKRIPSFFSLPALLALVLSSVQRRGIRFMPLRAFPSVQIWKK